MREFRVVLTPDAAADLREIAEWIAEASGYPERALNYVRKLRERTQKLAHAPHRGTARDDLRAGIRLLPADRRCVIAFEIDEDDAIVRVLSYFYGGRDYEVLIGGEDR